MSLTRDLRRAERHLASADAVMRQVIAEVGPSGLDATQRGHPFPALVETIVAQQISTAAARAIHARLVQACGGSVSARRLLLLDDEQLRAAGLSRQKVRYLRDLASRVASRQLPLARLERLDDEAVVEQLTSVKGIGRWTAEIFMIFRLGRLDLMPVDDLGLLDGARVLYGLPERPTGERLLEIAEPWRPYRSVGAWYLWQGRRRARGEATR